MLASSFISYIGPFSSKFRFNINQKWIKDIIDCQIPITDGINPLEVLTTIAKMA